MATHHGRVIWNGCTGCFRILECKFIGKVNERHLIVECVKGLVCLQIHNDYQIAGGETKTAQLIADLLEENGIKVIRYYKSNKEFLNAGIFGKISVGLRSLGNRQTVREITRILDSESVDFALVHNVLPLISNTVYKILIKRNIPIIKYLQNYNLVCQNGALDRGDECGRCMEHPLVGIKNACYKNSRIYTIIRTFIKWDLDRHYLGRISAFMPNSEFVMRKHYACGIEKRKMHVMYNFISGEPCQADGGEPERTEYLYFGRIAREKGVMTAVRAFEAMPELKLKIVGSGEMQKELEQYLKDHKCTNIQYLGAKYKAELNQIIFYAKCVVVSSEWDEPLPRTILEAYLQGTPVIGADRGGIPEMIVPMQTGFLYESGSIEGLTTQVRYMEGMSRDEYLRMRKNCYEKLSRVYSKQSYFERFAQCVKEIM